MEKTNELNKLLSYIHMGNSIFRIYYENAKELNENQLLNLIVKSQEMFKKHEETITRLIDENNEEATKSITYAGLMGIYKEKLKSFEDAYSICKAAIKSTNMGMLSTLKFIKENEKLPNEIIREIKEMIDDYLDIQKEITCYILKYCIK